MSDPARPVAPTLSGGRGLKQRARCSPSPMGLFVAPTLSGGRGLKLVRVNVHPESAETARCRAHPQRWARIETMLTAIPMSVRAASMSRPPSAVGED